jgi:hypothetical protein
MKIKNHGEIKLYFLERIRPEMSRDELGINQNDRFCKEVVE